jgi:uncharacterized protein (DUF2236 family)
MRRTGLAAMIFTYGSSRDVEAMTSRVRRMHDRVNGTTPDGQPYQANDPELLTWVYATAAYGFMNAYLRYEHSFRTTAIVTGTERPSRQASLSQPSIKS